MFAGSTRIRDSFDPDAWSYIQAVETADGQPLEAEVRRAITRFVKGCKKDGIWDAIKASCIMAGARTLEGALTPLVGAAPTNFNFVAADYNRKTGLKGNGVDKYLHSNRNNNVDPQNSKHLAVYATELETGRINPALIGSGPFGEGRSFITALNLVVTTIRGIQAAVSNEASTNLVQFNDVTPGFIGVVRSDASGFTARFNEANMWTTLASQPPQNAPIWVFARPFGSENNHSAHYLTFYSIGESLNLELLDNRITTLMQQFNAVIP